MRYYTCESCKQTFEFNSKSSYKRFCPVCKRKRRSQQEMLRRKKTCPEIELGVGSGRNSKNLNQPIGVGTYHRIAKEPNASCELCGSTEYLLVHHKDHNRYNNTRNNLQVLCKGCYQQHHVKRDKITGQFIKQT